jgi:6-phosphogluconolactonase
MPDGVRLHRFGGQEEFLAAAACWLGGRLTDGDGAVALTGGGTAKALYQTMAALPDRNWTARHWFWGDERLVPPTSPDSNAGLALPTILKDVPKENIHLVPHDAGSPDAAAARYAATLRMSYGTDTLMTEKPLFDLMLLSLGPDGHIASLFPGAASLNERTKWAVGVSGRELPRVSLTLPALESAKTVVLLAAGAAKAEALAGYLAGDASLPATALKPLCGIELFADAAALAKAT